MSTIKHHTTRTAGILLSVASAPFLAGSLLGWASSGGGFATFFTVLSGLSGLALAVGVVFIVMGYRGLKKARRKLNEKAVLKQIAQKHGRVTAAEIATSSTLDIEESRQILQRLCDLGEGDRQILPSGKFLYVFDDFLPLDQKEAARDPFKDPLSDLIIE